MTSRPDPDVYGGLVDHLIEVALSDARIRALWIEGASMQSLRRPYAELEVHLATDEPSFSPVHSELEGLVGAAGELTDPRWSDVTRFARQLEGSLDGAPITVILEKTSLLAKRPRSAVLARPFT